MPEDILKEAIGNYENSVGFYQEQRDKCVQDIRFAYIDESQWDDRAKNARRNRPRYTINKVVHSLNLATGAYRKSKITGKVRGWKNIHQAEIAETYTGLIRNIEKVSKAKQIFARSYQHINAGGFSAWRVMSLFPDEDTFDQELRIAEIADPWYSVWPDSSSRKFDSSDWDYCLITTDMSKVQFKKKYPNASMHGFQDLKNFRFNGAWETETTVKVAEYWTKTMEKDTLYLMSDGMRILHSKAEKILDDLANEGITIVKQRPIERPKVQSYKISGVDVLEGPFDWPGKVIPIVPVYGYSEFINNDFHYRGKVRFVKDAQRIYNYTTSANVESIALSPKDPYWYTPTQMGKFGDKWKRHNLTNDPFLPYNHDPKAPGPPVRSGPPSVQQGLILQIQQADLDIQATMGVFRPSLGVAQSPDQSGEAIRQLKNSSDTGTFDLIDNLANAIEYTNEILVDVLPKIYDTERQERILNSRGEEELIYINKTVVDQETGKEVIINDLSQGKYDVSVGVTPSFDSQRQEALVAFGNILQTNLPMANTLLDLYVENIEAPNIDEIKKRTRQFMLKQGLIEPNEEESQKIQQQQEAQSQDPMAKLQVMMLQEQFKKSQLETQKMMLDNKKIADEIDLATEEARAEISKDIADTIKKYVDAGIPIRPEDLVIRTLQNQKMIRDLQDQEKERTSPQPIPSNNEVVV